MIHPTAIVSPEAEVGEDVEIGPYSIINGQVKIGNGTKIESHVCIGVGMGEITIGEENHFYPGCVIGSAPQDLSYKGDDTALVIGDKNLIREYVTINLGTKRGRGVTQVGHHNFLMAYVHIAHDCQLGDFINMANSTDCAGHVDIGDHITIGGRCGIAQHVRLGQLCYIGGGSLVNKDVLPFSIAEGQYALMRATNKIGLERAQIPKDEINLIHKALRYIIKSHKTTKEALQEIREDFAPSEYLNQIVNFVQNSKNGLAL